MNITGFYAAIGAVLVAIFLFFKPLKVDIANPGDLPQIELQHFMVHEVTTAGVKTILAGQYARRYEDRYVVTDVNLTDRNERHIENMQAGRGIYREPIVILKDHVRYRRDDGVRFRTDYAEYNQTSGQLAANDDFVLRRGTDRLNGKALQYNTITGDIAAKQIVGVYLLKESE